MKKLTLVALVIAGLLSGCVAYEEPHDGRDHEGYHHHDHDHDHDGVPDREDSRPNNPNRY